MFKFGNKYNYLRNCILLMFSKVYIIIYLLNFLMIHGIVILYHKAKYVWIISLNKSQILYE